MPVPDSGTLVGVCALAYAAMSAVQSWMLTGSDRLVARFAWTAVTMSFLSLLLVPLTLR